jgi:pyocin large subunit-like protein
MDKQEKRWSLERLVVLGAIAVGLTAGTYGIASAANGSASSQSAAPPASNAAASSPNAQNPWGRQRSDETLLTGDAAAKVRQAALAKVSGATIIRVETDADGNAAYEAHVVKADGTPATVYVNKQFEVVSVQTGMPGAGRAYGNSRGSSGASA